MNAIRSLQLEGVQAARVAVIVAHPDDETLWAGGLLLGHPEWTTFIVGLCRGGDPDRAPRFRLALERLGAKGILGNLDDGPEQYPLPPGQIEDALLALLPIRTFDLVLTHAPEGEYTTHRRHGEVSLAVRELWRRGDLQATSLWQFAYEDGAGAHLPRPRAHASCQLPLTEELWRWKLAILADCYGFAATSWEVRAAPRSEAFDGFDEPGAIPPWGGEGRELSR